MQLLENQWLHQRIIKRYNLGDLVSISHKHLRGELVAVLSLLAEYIVMWDIILDIINYVQYLKATHDFVADSPITYRDWPHSICKLCFEAIYPHVGRIKHL